MLQEAGCWAQEGLSTLPLQLVCTLTCQGGAKGHCTAGARWGSSNSVVPFRVHIHWAKKYPALSFPPGLFQSFQEAASAPASSTAARSPSVMSCLPPSTSASSLDAQYYANCIPVPSTCEHQHEALAPQATALGYKKKCHKHKPKLCIIL